MTQRWTGLYSDAADFALLPEYGKSLEDDIRSDTSFMFQRVLVSLSAVSRALSGLLLMGVEFYRDACSKSPFPALLTLSSCQM